MKTAITAAAILLAGATMANAADLQGRGSQGMKDAAGVSVSWEGPYIGAQAGYGDFGDSEKSAEGGTGGATLGYRLQRGSLVFGPYASVNWSTSSIKFPGDEEGDAGGKVEKGIGWSAGGEAGWLLSKDVLGYVKVGYTQNFYNEKRDGGTNTFRLDGVEFGGGAEVNVGPGISIGAEYLRREMSEEGVSENLGLVTAKYRFPVRN